jgi:hypothetical protein
MLTKKEVQELMKIKGETRGTNLKINLKVTLESDGQEVLKKIEAKMEELGSPLKYKEIETMDFYPIGLGATLLLVIKEFFNFSEKDIEKRAAFLVKFSIIEKIFMGYFSSLDLIAKQVPDMWRRHYTVGDLEMSEYSEEKGYSVLRLRNFKIHPIYCTILKGYFAKITELIVKSPAITKETKCMFQGDEYHEFVTKW